MDKKQIMFLAVLCILCFGASFGVAWFNRPKAAVAVEPKALAKPPQADTNEFKIKSLDNDSVAMQRSMSEKQLKLLVQGLRTRIADYEKKLQELDARQQRLTIAKESLLKDVNELNSLRIQVANEAAQLKQQQQKLDEYQIKIAQDEQVNIKKTATIYDKMDSASASKIFINMCTNRQLEDAVKIINYMAERTAAKVLSEIGTADPKIASDLVTALKKLKETN